MQIQRYSLASRVWAGWAVAEREGEQFAFAAGVAVEGREGAAAGDAGELQLVLMFSIL
jgi:hypothetical protein